MLHDIREILRKFYYTFIVGRPRDRRAPKPIGGPTRPLLEGMNGPLNVDALLVRERERDKLVLVVDENMRDIPVWVDWDIPLGVIGVALQNGGYATLGMTIANEHHEELKGLKRLLIVTKTAEMNIVHHVPFIVRDE